MTKKNLLFDTLGWGIILWFIGYILGLALYFIVPVSLIGWIIMPVGSIITLWVLLKKIKSKNIWYYFSLSVIWASIAIILDYIFLVKLLNPADGYYKIDVYVYYIATFCLPLIVYLWKKKK